VSDLFKDFLKTNRPLAGEAPPGERRAIWARIAGSTGAHFPTRPLLWRFVAAAAVVLMVFAFSLRTLDRPGEELTNEEVLSESLSHSFLEDDGSDELYSFNFVAD